MSWQIGSQPRQGGSLLAQEVQKPGCVARKKQGRNARSTLLIVEAQASKTDTAGQKGYDAAKKVSGIKRHLVVDSQGFAHVLSMTTAEGIRDRKGGLFALVIQSIFGAIDIIACYLLSVGSAVVNTKMDHPLLCFKTNTSYCAIVFDKVETALFVHCFLDFFPGHPHVFEHFRKC